REGARVEHDAVLAVANHTPGRLDPEPVARGVGPEIPTGGPVLIHVGRTGGVEVDTEVDIRVALVRVPQAEAEDARGVGLGRRDLDETARRKPLHGQGARVPPPRGRVLAEAA